MFDSMIYYFNKFSDFIYSDPKYFGTLQLIELIIFIKLIYWDNLLNLSIAYPTLTQFFVFAVIFFYLLLFLLCLTSDKMPVENCILKKQHQIFYQNDLYQNLHHFQ